MFSRIIFLFVIGVLLNLNSNSCQAQTTAFELAKSMFIATKEINSMKFTMKKMERIEDDMREQVSAVKLSLNP